MTEANNTATPTLVGSSEGLAPVAEVKCGHLQWAIPRDDYQLSLRFLNNDTHPLYDQAALDAAVAAERERWAKLRTAAAQVLTDMRAQGVLLEWQTLMEEALRA